MTRVLFLAEAVTWSQVVRLVVLARALDPREFEVHFASARFDDRLFSGTNFRRWPLTSRSAEEVEAAVARGAQIYDEATLGRYVAEELALFSRVRPDVVVSDLRWSTAVSAPTFGVPCATLIDAYWSRRAARERFPLPDHPTVRVLGERVAGVFFPLAMPFVFRRFAAPIDALRTRHGLSPLGDLVDVLTWGDRVLFPDDPLVTPLTTQAPHEVFLGPVRWTPDAPLPPWWDEVGRDRPMVYATLGSSGAVDAVPAVLEGLGGLDVDVVFSTASRVTPRALPANVRVVELVRGDLAARRASVVVCNGGASTGYQALAEGTPIVGVPSNLDAYLAATAIRDAGGGVLVRASTATPDGVRAAVGAVLADDGYRRAARRIAASFATFDPHARFADTLRSMARPRADAGGP